LSSLVIYTSPVSTKSIETKLKGFFNPLLLVFEPRFKDLQSLGELVEKGTKVQLKSPKHGCIKENAHLS